MNDKVQIPPPPSLNPNPQETRIFFYPKLTTNHFEVKIFWTQKFLVPKFILDQRFFLDQICFWTQKFFWTKSFLVQNKTLEEKKNVWATFFLDSQFFWTQNIFGQRIFRDKNLFWSKTFLDTQFFLTKFFWFKFFFNENSWRGRNWKLKSCLTQNQNKSLFQAEHFRPKSCAYFYWCWHHYLTYLPWKLLAKLFILKICHFICLSGCHKNDLKFKNGHTVAEVRASPKLTEYSQIILVFILSL